MKALDERLSIDNEVMDVEEALLPQNLSKLTKENTRSNSIHQLLHPDFELREVSRSLSIVVGGAESIQYTLSAYATAYPLW